LGLPFVQALHRLDVGLGVGDVAGVEAAHAGGGGGTGGAGAAALEEAGPVGALGGAGGAAVEADAGHGQPAVLGGGQAHVVPAALALDDADGSGVRHRGHHAGIIERQGGWYHVRLASGQDGWLPMTSIRFNSGTTGTTQSTDWSSLFQSGRSGASGSTATTGVRGLNTGDIANAKPDIKAVESLDKWQAKSKEAKEFAAAVPLKSNDKGYLPEVKP